MANSLNEHQRQIYEDFVFNDLSLGEIASEEGNFKAGVADMIKRCNNKLEAYEKKKLHLVKSLYQYVMTLRKYMSFTSNFEKSQNEQTMTEIKLISNQILEEL